MSTLPNPTLEALIPVDILASVTALFASLFVVITPLPIIGTAAVPLKSPANFKIPFLLASASATLKLELLEPPFPMFTIIAESTYVFTALTEGNLVSEFASPLISSD